MNYAISTDPKPSGRLILACSFASLTMIGGFFAGMYVGAQDARLMRADEISAVKKCEREYGDGTAFRDLKSRSIYCFYGSHRLFNPKKAKGASK